MNQIDKQITSEIEATADAEADSRPVGSSSRRRLIKLGASAVPVLATLTSQSALAGVCISTSAWGSDVLSKSSSQAARHAGNADPVTTGFTITAWNTNDSSNAAWTAFKVKYPTYTNATNANLRYFDPSQLSFGDLYNLADHYYMRDPSSLDLGFNLSHKVVGRLIAEDRGYFMVAMLNYLVGARPPADCVSDADWRLIVAGTYPPLVTSPWTVQKIVEYLKSNYIVQP